MIEVVRQRLHRTAERSMDPAEILTVRFHFGGEFVHIGKELDYVGGDEAISEIERDKLSLQELTGFLKDQMEVKESMKLYFLHPGKELVNGKDGFEVRHLKGRQRRYTVNLQNRTCSCGYFQLAGLPCSHAISAIYKCGKTIDEFIDKCYSIEIFNKIYENCLEPVEGEDKWPVSPKPRPQAPGYVRMSGRPKKNDRRREEGEAPKGKKMSRAGIVITCSFCDVVGHNKSGCKQNPEKGKKKNAHLAKSGKKMKQGEQAQTDAGKAASSTPSASDPTSTSTPTAPIKQFKPPRAATPKAPVVARAPTTPSAAARAPTAPTRTSPRRAAQATGSSSNQQGVVVPTRGKKRLLTGKMKGYLTASGNY